MMKRIFALALVIAMLCALFCACSNNSSTSGAATTTTVKAQYDDGYATRFAKSTSTDKDGNKVYEFEGDQYDKYIDEHGRALSSDIMKDIASQHKEKYGEYAYINDEKQAIIVGVHKDEYDEKTAKAEAESIAEYGFKYFQSLKTPVDTVKVIYCDANNQETVFGTFEFTAK